jgi:hypothetical protein
VSIEFLYGVIVGFIFPIIIKRMAEAHNSAKSAVVFDRTFTSKQTMLKRYQVYMKSFITDLIYA